VRGSWHPHPQAQLLHVKRLGDIIFSGHSSPRSRSARSLFFGQENNGDVTGTAIFTQLLATLNRQYPAGGYPE
jgi:hypothetical protein